jgi:hypothetical protein
LRKRRKKIKVPRKIMGPQISEINLGSKRVSDIWLLAMKSNGMSMIT